jgi:hypothetical protein
LHIPGGLYHVILRGNNRQQILYDDVDRLELERFKEYAWSSHAGYLGLTENPWLTTEWVLSQFSNYKEPAQQRFARFVETPGNGEYECMLEFSQGHDGRLLDNDECMSSVSERSTAAVWCAACRQ